MTCNFIKLPHRHRCNMYRKPQLKEIAWQHVFTVSANRFYMFVSMFVCVSPLHPNYFKAPHLPIQLVYPASKKLCNMKISSKAHVMEDHKGPYSCCLQQPNKLFIVEITTSPKITKALIISPPPTLFVCVSSSPSSSFLSSPPFSPTGWPTHWSVRSTNRA